MLFYLTGSSAAGKTTLAAIVAGRVPDLVARDTDEYGVPSGAGGAWRQEQVEQWVGRVLTSEAEGVDVLLCGQSPLGEILAVPCRAVPCRAVPSAPKLAAIAVCLVEVSDDERGRRLRDRQPGVWSEDEVGNFNLWAQWHRRHAEEPGTSLDAIRRKGWSDMQWDRWSSWSAGDARWRTSRLDTDGRTVQESARDLESWVRAERRLVAGGTHPLARGWAR